MTPLILKIKTDKNGVPTLSDAKEAIGTVESAGSGGYTAVGPRTKKGDRAYGKYQVMGANIPSWTKEVTGKAMTPQQFLDAPAVQDAVFNKHFGEAMAKYGNAQDAASVWFSGKPLSQAAGRRDVTGTSAEQYVNKFNAALGDPSATSATSATPRAFGLPVVPAGDLVDLSKRRAAGMVHDPNVISQQERNTGVGPAIGGGFGNNVINLTPQRAFQAAQNVARSKMPDSAKYQMAAQEQAFGNSPAAAEQPMAPGWSARVGQKPDVTQQQGAAVPWLRDPVAIQNNIATRLAKAQTTMPPAAKNSLASLMGEIGTTSNPTARATLITQLHDILTAMGY